MQTVQIKIDQIDLDISNPRLPIFASARESLQAIVIDQGVKLYELAQDIVRKGLSPAHQILAIKASSKKNTSYIALDGNRRIAALKLLTNPNFLDSVEGVALNLKNLFKKLASDFDRATVEPITIAVMESREAGNRWIELIHTGENKGRGVVTWDGVATERFRGASSPALDVLNLLKKNRLLSDESYEKFPITNLDRLLSTPEVRTALGLSIKENITRLLYPLETLLPLLSHVANLLANKEITVSQLKNKADRIKFANNIPANLTPNKNDVLPNPPTIQEALCLPSKVKNLSAHTYTSSGVNLLRKTLIPASSKCKLVITSVKIQSIAAELKKLKLEENPLAIAVLLRVFIELSMDHFAKLKMINAYDPHTYTLFKKVPAVADYLQANGVHKNELSSFRRIASNINSPLHIDRLHKFIHSEHALPTPSELRTGWDEVQTTFEKIWS